MKKTILIIVLISLLCTMLTSCFGNFALTRKVYQFNESIENKFVRTLALWGMMIIPVYPIATAIDFYIINLIEFWSGSNPVAMGENDVEIRYYAHDDKTFRVTITKNRYDISEVDNPSNEFAIVFSENELAWYMHRDDSITLMTRQGENETHFFDLEGQLFRSLPNN